jgi:hypothetical protein
MRLPFDQHAQIKIDAHLLAAAYAAEAPPRIDPLRLVLLPADAPQLARLPDLGPVVRACLAARRWDGNYLLYLVHACLPCPRPPAPPVPPDAASVPFLLNLLLATLLGLYPQCVKQPPFPVRVALARRVHAALTLEATALAAFAAAAAPLLMLALSEYLCHVLPAFMPAEHAALCAAFPVEAFFSATPGLFDLFRQDHLDTGLEPWPALAAAAAELHDRLTRAYRAKCRLAPLQRRPPPGEASPAQLRAALAAPSIVRYPCHAASDAALRGEYALLLGDQRHAETAAIHSLVAAAPLPANVLRAQLDALAPIAQRCQRQARVRRTHYLCLRCERRGRKGKPRLCSRTFRVVCQDCDDSPDSVVAIDAVGRVLTVHGRQLIFAPCCGRIREYSGGADLLPGPCPHEPRPRAEGHGRRPSCGVCDGPALSRAHGHLDPGTCRMATVHLCQRHTPPDEWTRRVPNMRHFERVCADWARRVKALHKRG